ncbi:MAG: homing endonuclease associated repeat-containing protein [Armatimonadota bacterium]
MRFELDDYTRGLSDDELLADLRSVAERLGKDMVTMREYDKHGRCHSSTLRHRFGSWFITLDKAGLKRTRNLNISTDDLLADLRCVAVKLGKETITGREYDDNGMYGSSTFLQRFGAWHTACEKVGLKCAKRFRIPDAELFENIENIWIRLGRQPRYGEIERPLSQFSAGVYENRFGGWRKALQAFVDWINSDSSDFEATEPVNSSTANSNSDELAIPAENRRDVGMGLRFRVMQRDRFKCILCGRSPANEIGVELHVDHIHPFSKGGKTTAENLQTLCKECNLGKSDSLLANA